MDKPSKRKAQEIRKTQRYFEEAATRLTGRQARIAKFIAEEAEARLKPKDSPPNYNDLVILLEANNEPIPIDLKKCIPHIQYYFEQSNNSLSEFSKAVIKDMGEEVRPYLQDWYLGIKHYNSQRTDNQLTLDPEG